MLKYVLRYVPLLILALLLIPLRVYMAGRGQAFPYQVSSPFRPGSALYSVSMLSSNDVWAVGGSFVAQCNGQDKRSCSSAPSSGIILHYADNAWAVAGNTREPLLAVSLDSPQDGWAVGYTGTLVHYDGHTWSTVPGPTNFNKNLLGVTMLSPSDGWAVGYSGSILHYDGKQWKQVQSPATVDLRSVAMSSQQEGWAVGDSGTILHYSKGSWSAASSPTNNTLNNVSLLSTSEGWAVGKQGTILHYRDGTWESVHPTNYYRDSYFYQSVDLFGVAMSSIRSGWIIGDQHFLTYSSEAWIEPRKIISPEVTAKYSGLTPDQLSLYSIAMSPSGESWAVGSAVDSYNGGNAIVILHYQGDTWAVALLLNGG